MGISKFILPVVVVFSILLLSSVTFASISLNVSLPPTIQTNNSANLGNTNVTITGSIKNTTTSDNVSFINVTAKIGNNSYWTVTLHNGSFSFNVSAPPTVGEYVFNISTNSSSVLNKTFGIFASNASTGNISFIGGKFPPFTNGTTFTVNITLYNFSTNSSPLIGYQPRVRIFQSNGQNVSWTVNPVNPSLATNSTQTTNSTGSIAYNITVPSTATVGEYVIDVDFGKAFSIFSVGSNYQMAVSTLSTSDEVLSNFVPGSTVNILAKLRTTSGSPVTGATVTAVITYPNGTTTRNITLSAHPSSSGYYNNTFTTESARGTYKVKVGALISGNDVSGSATFGTQTFSARAEAVKNAFFFEWGGKSAFKPGESISLDILAVNLTSGDVMNWGSCTGGNYTFLGVTFVNGTNTTIGNASVTLGTDQYLPSVTACKTTFTAPRASGTYNIKVNVTVGAETQTADGYFSVSNYFMKVTPVLDTGGFEGFKQVFAPGTNITIQLKARNVSGNTPVNQSNITGHIITKLVPLEFTSGASEVTNINQTSYNGVTNAAEPNITFTLPSSISGPLLIEVSATLNSSAGNSYLTETTTASTFIISNYLEGFLGPQKGGGMPSHEGEGASGFNSDAQCSGVQQFSGTVSDVNSSTAAQGASVAGIIQAREDETGRDVSSYLSITNSTASDSSGSIAVNITFTPTGGYSFSGNYFMVFNASYKGNFAGIPAFFTCRSLNMGFPQIKALGSDQQFSWQVAPTSALNITLTNVANMSGTIISNVSVFSLGQIFTFNPSTGTMQVLRNNTPLQINFTTNSGNTATNASLTIYPQNYTLGSSNLTRWPNGFFDLRPRVVSNLGTDTGFGGFMVVAFDAFPEFSFGQQYAAGSTQSVAIRAATNVSNFTITMGRPWEGVLETATINSANISTPDGWNNSAQTGNWSFYSVSPNGPYEKWNINFTVPSSLRKGGSMLTVKITSNATGIDGESVEVPLFVTVTKYNVVLPFEEGIGQPSSSQADANWIIADNLRYPLEVGSFVSQEASTGRNTTAYGWNMTWLNDTLKINSTSGRVCVKNTFNSTRYTQGGQQNIAINGTNNTRILVLDRTSTYDTVILNTSGAITILNATNRNLTAASGSGGLYLWDMKDCSFFTVINTTNGAILQGNSYISNNNGGSHQVNQNFTIPYVVVSGGSRQNGVPVTTKAISKQDNRGFGFEGKLTSSQATITGATTDANGVAFVTLNVTRSGRMMAFWSTTINSDTDSADMSTATTLEMKAFSTSAQSVTPLTQGVVTLINDTRARTAWSAFTANNWAFNASVTETTDGNFVQNGIADTWHIAYNSTNNNTVINNGTPLNEGGLSQLFSNTFVNGTIRAGNMTSVNLKIGEWNNGTSANNYTKTAVFYTDASGSPNRYGVITGTENITALICAQGFQKPTGVPVDNATVNVSVTDWSAFPPSVKYLDMYKISDASQASPSNPILTSPSGCALFKIGPGRLSTWPSAAAGKPPVFIEGTVTTVGGSSEFVYVGDVFRA
ncbi:MAG: hypothetical protein HYW24_03820 [Candidatus Aenigmarchaeota archaeon]|nr:hypothetical protein [Candidatus Aenigmarchaeota archaeon]